MACYDPNSLTASMTGELSVNLKSTGSLAVDVNGIYVDFVGAKVTKTAVQSILDNTETIVTWDSEIFDTTAIHDNVTNNSRLTVPTAGVYIISAALVWGTTTGSTLIRIVKNGTNVALFTTTATTTTGSGEVSGTFMSKCVANDYFEIKGYQNSGGSKNITITDSYFAVHKLAGSS